MTQSSLSVECKQHKAFIRFRETFEDIALDAIEAPAGAAGAGLGFLLFILCAGDGEVYEQRILLPLPGNMDLRSESRLSQLLNIMSVSIVICAFKAFFRLLS